MAYKIDKKRSLFKLLKNSLGTKLFRSVYFFVNNKSIDIYQNGKLSCAFYVSTILKIIGLIENIHATVESTIKDLEKSGWYKIEKPRKGAVLVWENRNNHYHLGFYLEKNKAISNFSSKGVPLIHKLNNNRKIIAIYFHKDLE